MNKTEMYYIRKEIDKCMKQFKGRMVICPYGAYGEYAGKYIKEKYNRFAYGIDNYRSGEDIRSFSDFLDDKKVASEEYNVIIATADSRICQELKLKFIQSGVKKEDIISLEISNEINKGNSVLVVENWKDKIENRINRKKMYARGKSIVREIASRYYDGIVLFSLAAIGDTLALASFSSHVKKMYDMRLLISHGKT